MATKPNILEGLPDYLKDPKRFKRIEKRLADILVSDHKHKAIKTFVKCPECAQRRADRAKLMTKIGFKNVGQYLQWKKVMDIIINKRNV